MGAVDHDGATERAVNSSRRLAVDERGQVLWREMFAPRGGEVKDDRG
jgi:hypothetical protein